LWKGDEVVTPAEDLQALAVGIRNGRDASRTTYLILSAVTTAAQLAFVGLGFTNQTAFYEDAVEAAKEAADAESGSGEEEDAAEEGAEEGGEDAEEDA